MNELFRYHPRAGGGIWWEGARPQGAVIPQNTNRRGRSTAENLSDIVIFIADFWSRVKNLTSLLFPTLFKLSRQQFNSMLNGRLELSIGSTGLIKPRCEIRYFL